MRRRRAVVDPNQFDDDDENNSSNTATNIYNGATKRLKRVFFVSVPFVLILYGYCHYIHYFDGLGFGATVLFPFVTTNQNDSNTNNTQNNDPPTTIHDDDNDDNSTDDGGYYNNPNNPPTQKFQWSFLNPTIPGTCGHNKCFFTSNDNPTEGYIIAYTTKANLTLGWERARMLEEKYGTRHFYAEAPEIVPVEKDLWEFAIENGKKAERKGRFYPQLDPMEFLNRTGSDVDVGVGVVVGNAEGGGVGGSSSINALDNGKDDQSPSYIFKIQKVRKAPDPFLEWGDRENRKQRCREQLALFHSSIPNTRKFSEQLHKEILDLNETLWREYWLIADFQVIIDQQGLLYHYDLDRNLKSDGNEMSPYFLSRERYILKNLRKIADGVQGSTIPC